MKAASLFFQRSRSLAAAENLCSPEALTGFFQTLIYLLTGIGFTMLALAAQIAAPLFLLFLLFYVPAFRPAFSARLRLSYRQGNWLTWAYVPVFVLDTFVVSRSFVPATLHLILFVQVVKMYQPKQDRDYFYLLILSFLQVLAASSLTIDLSFLILFVVYVLVCLAALMTFEMKRSLARAAQEFQQNRQPATPGQRKAETLQWRIKGPRLMRNIGIISGASVLGVFVLGATLFFSIPRFGSGYFHRLAQRSSSLSGFSDNVRLGGIGAIQLDPAVVMRVRVSDPTLLRGAKWRGVTLDYFDGKSWSKRVRGMVVNYPAGRDFRLNLERGAGTRVSYQILLEPGSTNYLFTVDRILRLQGNLAPVSKDPSDDTITARSHPFRRLTYQAESLLRLPDAGSDSFWEVPSPAEQQAYLQLPGLDPRILELALRVSAGATGIEAKARLVERYLQTNYSYSLEQSELESAQPLASFLFQSKRGHCEYFSSSMVVLLRALRIPARIVNGFQAGEYNDIGDDFVIRGRDAHSWVEVLVPEKGWLPFDPTPPLPASISRNPLLATFSNYLDAFELFWAEWVVGYDDVIQVSLFRDLHDKTTGWVAAGQRSLYERMLAFQRKLRSWLAGFESSNRFLGSVLVGFLAAGVAAVLGRLTFRHLRWRYWRRRARQGRQGSLAVRLYQECLAYLAARGKGKPPHLTPSEYAAALQLEKVRAQVQELTNIYNLARFSGQPLEDWQVQRSYELLRKIQAGGDKQPLIGQLRLFRSK